MKLCQLFTIVIATFSTLAGFAQPETFEGSAVYVKIYGAYGLFTPGSFKGVSNNDNNDVNVVKVHRKGMGGGVRAGAGFGVIINKFVNVGIDGEYLKGNKITVNVSALEGSLVKTRSTTAYEHSIFSVIPNITLKVISKPAYSVYSRVGVVVGIPLSVTEDENYEYHYNDAAGLNSNLLQRDISTTFNGEHTLKTSIGYQGALGVQKNFSEKFSGFLEVAAYGISFDRMKYEDSQRVTRQTDIRKDQSAAIITIDNSRYIKNYVKSGVSVVRHITGTSNNYVYSSQLAQEPLTMNALTIGIGLSLRF